MHTARMVHPAGLRRGRRFAGLARALNGLNGAFELNLTPPGGGVPVSQSVQTSEAQVGGTFAATAPTLLDASSLYQTVGMITDPFQSYLDGSVIGGGIATGNGNGGLTFEPQSPMDAIAGATRTASDAAQGAHEAALDPSVSPPLYAPGESIDGSWQVRSGNGNGLVLRNGNGGAAGMQWWQWGLIGLAVLGGGFVLTRAFAR